MLRTKEDDYMLSDVPLRLVYNIVIRQARYMQVQIERKLCQACKDLLNFL